MRTAIRPACCWPSPMPRFFMPRWPKGRSCRSNINSTPRAISCANSTGSGVTGAIDAGGGFQNYPEDYAVIQKLAEDGQLTIRLAYNLFTQKPKGEKDGFPQLDQDLEIQAGRRLFPPQRRRRNAGLLGGRLRGFPPAASRTCRAEMEGELEEVVRILAQNRWPWRLHATYDETISRALDVFEKVNRDIPLEGLQLVLRSRRDDLGPVDRADRRARRRHRRPAPHGLSGRIFRRALRPRRRRGDAADRRMLRTGVKISAGTDATRVASYNPWVSLAWLVTGKTVAGLRLYPQRNCLDRETALRMWTENVTWFSNEEGKKGRIEVGQFADLIVPDRDYFACAEDEIADINVGPHHGRRQSRLRRRRFCRTRQGRAAARHAGLVAGAHLRRLWRVGRCESHRQIRARPKAGDELRLRQCLQRPRPQPRRRMVEPVADRRSEIVLGRARLLLLGRVMLGWLEQTRLGRVESCIGRGFCLRLGWR